MTLTNYWWLLIWLFVGGGILTILIPKQRELVEGKMEERWSSLAAFLLILPYIFWAGFRQDLWDTASYRQAFAECASSFGEINTYLTGITKDKGFYFLMALVKSVFGNSDVIYFLVLAVFQLFIIMWLCRKYS